jgi:hypothetical protein
VSVSASDAASGGKWSNYGTGVDFNFISSDPIQAIQLVYKDAMHGPSHTDE